MELMRRYERYKLFPNAASSHRFPTEIHHRVDAMGVVAAIAVRRTQELAPLPIGYRLRRLHDPHLSNFVERARFVAFMIGDELAKLGIRDSQMTMDLIIAIAASWSDDPRTWDGEITLIGDAAAQSISALCTKTRAELK